jgi:transposase-like protein
MMAERGLSLGYTTVMGAYCSPELECRWGRLARPVGPSWRVDEAYVMISGGSVYLYRAVDRAGNTADFNLKSRRDVGAAQASFRRALRIRVQGSFPKVTTLNG